MGFLSPSDWSNAFKSDPTGAQGAAQTAANTQLLMFNKTQQNLQPYMQTGQLANTELGNVSPSLMQQDNRLNAALPGLTTPYSLDQYNASPEAAVTNNAMSDMMKQLMASSAAGGNLGSGNVATALQTNAAKLGLQGYQTGLQDYTNNNLNNYNMISGAVQNQQGQNLNEFNMLNTMAGSGQNAAAGLGGFGANVANQIGQNGINAAATNFATSNGAQTNLSNSLGQGVTNWAQASNGNGMSNAGALGTSIFGNSGTPGNVSSSGMGLENASMRDFASSPDTGMGNASMSDSAGWFTW